ncbi:hypothetical protein MHOL44478_12925 [Mycobacterium holsaticum DSM 44478]|nr:hypothetical protein [Mycolicibacterium holsaticum DSM 44478 = JCM 12374]
MTTPNRDHRSGYADPQSRPMASWQGRLAVMASRGEVDGPRVDECRRALAWWRCHNVIAAEVDRGAIAADRAAELIEHLTGALA